MNTEEISTAELFERVSVRDPYFALQEVRATSPGTLEARVAHLPATVSAADAARHLAVLGACAAGWLQTREGRHHYLVHQATLDLHPDAFAPEGVLSLRATAHFTDLRTAVVDAALSDERGRIGAELTASFRVVPERAFLRLFGEARMDLRRAPRALSAEARERGVARRRPALQQSLPLCEVAADGERGEGSLPAIGSALCQGHFPLHPVLPFNLVLDGLIEVARRVLEARDPHPRRSLKRVTFQAEHLALAGEPVRFVARLQASLGAEHRLRGEALAAGDKRVGRALVVLTGGEAAGEPLNLCGSRQGPRAS